MTTDPTMPPSQPVAEQPPSYYEPHPWCRVSGASAVELFGNEAFVQDVLIEVMRQDDIHPQGYGATRDGVFLGVTTAVHELDREAIEAWREERSAPAWTKTRAEIIQAAAICLRLVRDIDYPDGLAHSDSDDLAHTGDLS